MSERLWAPWRDAYVSAPPETSQEASQGCIFCAKPREDSDADNYIVYRAERVFVILNAYPYNNGHLMVVPYTHVGDLERAEAATLAEMMSVAQRCVHALRATMRPEAFNMGINLGRPAGAGIADHIHLHIVPRWTGDTNFMPVLGDTRVLSQSLESSYALLRDAFEDESATPPAGHNRRGERDDPGNAGGQSPSSCGWRVGARRVGIGR
jgi:ATP adenylyltransferase